MPRLLSIIALSIAAPAFAESPVLDYPETRRVDHADDYHGVSVPDPYRWLETDVRESDDVRAWVEAQNKVTFKYLESISERERIKERLTALWNFEKYSSPFKRGGRYYFLKNDGLQNQYVLYMQETLDDEPELLIDPNTWSKDGTIALAGTAFSDDGRYLAYGVQDAGSDWRTWKVMEIDSRRVLDDELKWVKFSEVSWTTDSRGFFYSRYDAPPEGSAFQGLNENQQVFYHRVGTPQSQDVLVYKRPDHPDWGFDAKVTEDGRYLVLTVWKGTDEKFRVLYKDLAEPYGMPVDLVDNFENEYTFVGNDGPLFYFKTDVEAPRRRLIAMDIRRPEREQWQEIIPQAEETLEGVSFVANMFIARYLQDAKTQVKIFAPDGKLVREVTFPSIGTADGFDGRRTDTETFYSFASFATPPSIYRYDMLTGKSELLRQAKVDFNPQEYEVKQVFYESKDGTRIPMFIAHKKGVKLDGNNPTLLYGYGGFNISLTPRFSISWLGWMEMGGVFAMANLRGGGEYGEEWHSAGIKANKQNVFDDFIAAAEWLIENKYTRPEKLAIQGGSNGGLLVGACMTQRPDLFGACLPAVGVMDMLRFQKFTAGRFWTDDYGSSDDPEDFKALFAYSPYHNLKEGIEYPPTLITTADTDDRVVPAHSFKFAARLQEAHAGEAPVLIRIETRAGHGAGKPTEKIIEEVADMWAFLVENLDVKLQ
ncbi:MAG: prolyl oligopeptidase family serine peptidase [Planctomycetes bacterium]|nr:prolyl oligopeptidase family serine peptidase [Planctomycetota bacterium]